MKKQSHIKKIEPGKLRAFGEFKARFYPDKGAEEDADAYPVPEEVGERMAKESLERLQAALAAI